MPGTDIFLRLPIKTAPRDGTVIWIGAEEVGAFQMYWHPTFVNRLVNNKPGIWISLDNTFTWIDGLELEGPDYWKPLLTPLLHVDE